MTLIGWSFLLASWIIPFFMRKQANTFVDRQKSYSVGMLLAVVALVIFVINGIIVYIK
jgi:hypothetical protein